MSHRRAVLLVALLSLLGTSATIVPALASHLKTAINTYQRPGTAAVGGVSQMCLIYHGRTNRLAWTPEMILPYVAHVDEKGRPTDWLFDSFLFTEFETDNGASLHHYIPDGVQATAEDWAWLADGWFRQKTGLIGLNGAVENAGQVLGNTNHKVNVVIALPIPFRPVKTFGPLSGEDATLDFSHDQDRLKALQWYVRRVLDHWHQANYSHLQLAGFYWTDETIPPENEELVHAVARQIHQLGYKLYWIPFFSPQGLGKWKQLGIDGTMLQPNYFFHREVDPGRLMQTAAKARAAGCGVEMEFDTRVFESQWRQDRFWDYLDAGVKYGWMTNSLIGYYEGNRGLHELANTPGSGREMYDALYHFVKGTYQPSARTVLPEFHSFVPALPPERNPEQNLALAIHGARVEGCDRPAGEPELGPENAIDGIIDNYGGQGGFAYFAIPGSMTIELPKTEMVARTQLLLWNIDDRSFQYQIETSLDNKHWQIAADKSRGQWTGWQVDNFAARKARFVRLTGLHDSRNNNFQVVEFEIYPSRSASK